MPTASVEAVPELARNAGFRLPVFMSRAAFEDCVQWTDADNARKPVLQDETGRFWDVLWMASRAIGRTRLCDQGRVPFEVWRVPRTGNGTEPELALVARVAAEVVTITLALEG